jgi:hypothetical protein
VKLENLSRESLAPYLPIQGAGFNLLGLLVSMAITVLGFVLLWVDLSADPNAPAMQLAGFFLLIPGVIFTACFVTILAWSHIESGGNLIKLWRAFHDRNIVGYELWCWIDENGQTAYDVRPGHQEYILDHRYVLSIRVPLRIGACCDIFGIVDYGWSLYVRDLALGIDEGCITLAVHDVRGDSVGMSVNDVLDVLTHNHSHNVDEHYSHSKSLHGLVMGLLICVRYRGEALLAERLDRDEAVAELYQAAERIDGTRRFIKSTQAATIRDWLRERFTAHQAVRPVAGSSQIGLM